VPISTEEGVAAWEGRVCVRHVAVGIEDTSA
jgi:hypothetical protein